ncbi:TPA: hypothetical protein TUO09_001204 [Streptococcus equi subsp. zooepidemicus]|uniref:hypothetical protein n=1 Tax=Streptococcus equi TaxID=1336 RepID=UPI000AF4EA99|nr:hypothetical protein [Streptococcus equi]MCD3443115.1 hypothetical protein [Streptococcus equi subsp. zooepidemicus]MDI5918428.1 hypothetical protein [Streptococcus equi subsp. zooepidemicus]MDI5956203.1 hypothetical protein [Streptococcus equi subsp. zooepidemicus]MDI5990929.1 hypothetical protein [Streptococcus equi subsp. zooepidemicus]UFR16984.1 hypothetical protein KVP03_02895 [Streptococcus equi subsp. zooepidemicus]
MKKPMPLKKLLKRDDYRVARGSHLFLKYKNIEILNRKGYDTNETLKVKGVK